MKPEIENLKVWMSGRITTDHQRGLAMQEFDQLLSYINELDQLYQPSVSGCSEQWHVLTVNMGDGVCIKCGKVLTSDDLNYR